MILSGAPLTILAVVGACQIAVLVFWALLWWLLDCPERLRGGITASLFLIGFSFAVWGFVEKFESGYGPPAAPAQIFADAVHSSLQLIAFGIEAKESRGWRLGVARVLLPLATGQLFLAALMTRARQWTLRARLRVRRPDVMVLGCGETGFRIARLFENLIDPRAGTGGGRGAAARRDRPSSRARRRILGVDGSLTDADALAFQNRFWLLQAPLESDETIRALRLDGGSGVVVCTGDQRRDFAILKQIKKAVAASSAMPPIVVSIDSDNLPRICQVDPALGAAYTKGDIQFIHPARLDARLLFQKHPPHSFAPGRFRVGERNRCHVALFAAPGTVDALASQAVRALVYDPVEPMRLTALVEDTEATLRGFFARFPALTQSEEAWKERAYGKQLPLARIAFVESRTDRIEPRVLRREHEAQTIDVVYVMGRDDAETCLMATEAFKVVSTIDEPRPGVVVCLRDLAMGNELAESALHVEQRFFRLASWAEPEAATSELAALVSRERGPRASASDTTAERLWRLYGPDPDAETWPKTHYDTKWWNRLAADHADLKLALLGLDLTAKAAALRPFLEDPPTRRWLARLEHRRYVCERMTDGWISCPEKKLNRYRLNHTLVPFDELDPDEQAKDERIVGDLAKLLEG